MDLTPKERSARGRTARSDVPRSSHAEWTAPAKRADPVSVLKEQAKTRVPELVPLRHARMLVSPFTFYRGAAAIMAADLASTPNSGLKVQCCGDAHLANFGGYQSPERRMVFDINDFDETTPGPWEWDVKRLLTSFAIAAQDRGFTDADARRAVSATALSYRTTIRDFATKGNLDVWYAHLDVDGVLARWRNEVSKTVVKRMERNVTKAESKNSLKAFAKLTEQVDGDVRIVNDPPLVERLDRLVPADAALDIVEQLRAWFHKYGKTLAPERRSLFESFHMVDIARKVVGVGSVGTRCWIVLLLGRDGGDPLFLQVKEAEASVLEPFTGKSIYATHGQRVVEGQRLMQASSDIFLGWERLGGFDGVDRDYYVRQLWDGKMSADLTTIEPELLPVYGQMCGWTLARAHARSGDRIAIGSYLGGGDAFDRAVVDFAFAYADQNARDYATVAAAARDGRIPVAPAEGAPAPASAPASSPA